MNRIYDIVIIGGGHRRSLRPGGSESGLVLLILEKGCLVNSLYNYPANMTFFSTSERIEIEGIPFVSNNVKPTRSEALEYYRRVAVSNHLHIHLQEKVLKIIPADGQQPQTTGDEPCASSKHFDVISSAGTYGAGHIVLATKLYDLPVLLNIPEKSCRR